MTEVPIGSSGDATALVDKVPPVAATTLAAVFWTTGTGEGLKVGKGLTLGDGLGSGDGLVLGDGLGDGLVLGDGLGDGLVLGDGLGDGLGAEAAVNVESTPEAALAKVTVVVNSPSLPPGPAQIIFSVATP
ncbi:MAG: hypothetical protein ACT4P1_06100, partial [Sporichthyaceae bacterium]